MPHERKSAHQPDEFPHEPDGQLDADALARQKVLGERLKSLFDDVAQEPVPVEFLDLLNQLSDSDPGDEPA